ncbi:MAG: hypothetical protein M1814_003048 [Vezdaea aestivalis]|nr:MAG: hypothetical protein M1814_003048 [Vezdaea aestivalis]
MIAKAAAGFRLIPSSEVRVSESEDTRERSHPIVPKLSSAALRDVRKSTARHDRVERWNLPYEPRSITHEQSVAEIRAIYERLDSAEQKCIEADSDQVKELDKPLLPGQRRLEDKQYRSSITLHQTLLEEHYEFLLVSHRPSSNAALNRLITEYQMKSRMWRFGIHSFLELLRHRLPESKDHMFTFLKMAYSMIMSLLERIKTFEITWIEYLGDLAHYYVAIKDDTRDRQIWIIMANDWYTKATDRSPLTGRLYHHCAILAKPDIQVQLFYYLKSLVVADSFELTHESILVFLNPILEKDHIKLQTLESDHLFVRFHARIFLRMDLNRASLNADGFLDGLTDSIGNAGADWKKTGAFQAASNVASLLKYGAKDLQPAEIAFFQHCCRMTYLSLGICLDLADNYLQRFPTASQLSQNDIPWNLIANMLNSLLRLDHSEERISSITKGFPRTEDPPRPLTEDFLLRGWIYAEDYFPPDWFTKTLADDDDARTLELDSMEKDRLTRIL